MSSGSAGSHVELNGGSSHYSAYAFWAGADDPSEAPFWVKKNGEMSATNGTFKGNIDAESITTGTLSVDRVNYQPAYDYTNSEIGSIVLSVTNSEGSSSIEISGGHITTQSKKIEFTGYAEFKSSVNNTIDGLSDGTTVINGGCITTGKIAAKYLNLTGAISFGDFNADLTKKINGKLDADDAITEDDINTYIDAYLVASPTISGGRLTNLLFDRYGKPTYDAYIEMNQKDSNWGFTVNIKPSWTGSDALFGVYDGDTSYVAFYGKSSCFLHVKGDSGISYPQGTWDFSDALITGLNVEAKFA